MSEQERRRLCDVRVTLNGRRARICGWRNDWATVRDDRGLSAEWAWSSAALVVSRGGRFES